MIHSPPIPTLFPSSPLFRSDNFHRSGLSPLPAAPSRRGWQVLQQSDSTCPMSIVAGPASRVEKARQEIGRAPSELQSLAYLVCRLLLVKKKIQTYNLNTGTH